jgi:ribosomal protein S24E
MNRYNPLLLGTEIVLKINHDDNTSTLVKNIA